MSRVRAPYPPRSPAKIMRRVRPSSQPRSGTARDSNPARRRAGALAGVLALAVLAGWAWWQTRPSGRTPATDSHSTPLEFRTDHLDPAVRALIEEAQRTVQNSPRDGAAWGRLGMIYHIHELPQEARGCYEQAEAFQPNNPRWPFFQGQLGLVENQELALKKFELAARLSAPEQDFPRLRLAQLWIERGQFNQAAGALRALLERRPEHALARLELGRLETL